MAESWKDNNKKKEDINLATINQIKRNVIQIPKLTITIFNHLELDNAKFIDEYIFIITII